MLLYYCCKYVKLLFFFVSQLVHLPFSGLVDIITKALRQSSFLGSQIAGKMVGSITQCLHVQLNHIQVFWFTSTCCSCLHHAGLKPYA